MNRVPYYKLADLPEITPLNAVKTVASTATPEALSATPLYCTKLTLQGQRAVQTDNTSDAYLGWTSGNGTQPYLITPGSVHVFTAPEGSKYNLADWYLDVGTNADGVVFIYE